MPRVVSKGSITGRSAFSNGGLGLSIGTRATKGIRHAISRRAPDNVKISGTVAVPIYKLTKKGDDNDINSYIEDTGIVPYFSFAGVAYAVPNETAVSLFAPFKIGTLEGITVNLGLGKNCAITNFNESLLKPTATSNEYTISIPQLSTIGTDWIETDSNGHKLYRYNTSPLNFGPIYVYVASDSFDTTVTNAINTYLSEKTYTLTMTGTDTFKITGNSVTETSFVALIP